MVTPKRQKSGLNKDQKRKKAKEAEARKSRERQHDRNREAKRVEMLADAINDALLGYIGTEEVEQAILACSPSTSNLKSTTLFGDFGHEIQSRVTRTVRLLSTEDAFGISYPVEGRAYFVDLDNSAVEVKHMPLSVAMASHWMPSMVPHIFGNEFQPRPSHVVYLFGIQMGDAAIHIAIAADLADPHSTETFLVSANKHWRKLEEKIWLDLIQPVLLRTLIARAKILGPSPHELAIAGLMAHQSGELHLEATHPTGRQLTKEERALLINAAQNLIEEIDTLVCVTRDESHYRSADSYEEGWAAGHEAAIAEADRLSGELSRLQRELTASQNELQRRARLITPHAAHNAEHAASQPLGERMASLFSMPTS